MPIDFEKLGCNSWTFLYQSDTTTDPLLPSGYDSSSRLNSSMDKNGPVLPSGRMSPPPSYDEVVFNVGETKKNINDNLSSYGIEF